MTDVKKLDEQIAQKLAAHKEECANRHNQLAEYMHAIEERYERFTPLADRLVREIIRPRVERLAAHFDNAMLQSEEQAGRHQCVCTFAHTARFPATAKLELGITRDRNVENVWVQCNMSILPLFVPV